MYIEWECLYTIDKSQQSVVSADFSPAFSAFSSTFCYLNSSNCHNNDSIFSAL